MTDAGATSETTPETTPGATPGTYVQVGPHRTHPDLLRNFGSRPPTDAKLAPDAALVLIAVLLAAAEQVNGDKLASFGVSSREDLTLLQLAMAFRGDDTGLVGDVFEWSLLLALNAGDAGIAQLVTDALLLANVPVDQPQAILVAAEPGRLVTFSPQLPSDAALATGRRGRPPYVANLLASADTRTWKADLLLGSGQIWVGASLKSNPFDLRESLRLAAHTPHPPRIGITASHDPGVVRDRETGAVVVNVPVYGRAMALSKMVLDDVMAAFSRHLTVSATPLQQDVTGIGWQLHRWRHRTVRYVTDILFDWVREARHGPTPAPRGGPLAPAWVPLETGASVPANGALIAVNTLVSPDRWFDGDRALGEPLDTVQTRHRYGQFDPID